MEKASRSRQSAVKSNYSTRNKKLSSLSKKIVKNLYGLYNFFKPDFLFKLGILLLPFENFFFAPSSGWATISPIFFFLYVLANFRSVKTVFIRFKKFLIGVVCVLLIGHITGLAVGMQWSTYIGAMISICLGLTNFFAFSVYCEKNKTIKSLIPLVIFSYSIAFAVGIIQYAAIKLSIEPLYDLFGILTKRNYLVNNRVQFCFTEPSFVGMHLFGVLLPVYYLSKDRRIIWLIILYLVLAIISSSGVRILVDAIVIVIILGIVYLVKHKRFKRIVLLVTLLAIAFSGFYNLNVRFKKIVDGGIYADGSFSSRFFRINASIKGYPKKPANFILGYGIGNSIIPLRDGYNEAVAEYNNDYTREVVGLGDPSYLDDSVSYSFYIRIVSEFGIVGASALVYYLIRLLKDSTFEYKYELFFITAYLYIQFESYVFYSLWLLICILFYTSREYEKYQTIKSQNETKLKKSNKTLPLISVIISAHNIEKYIDNCLESVVQQTYHNLEIIIVDDGSTDKTPELCEKWKKKDNRIKAIHQKNKGLSSVRNVGVKKSSGEYIVFVDGDDTVFLDYVDTLYYNLMDNGSDISMVKHFVRYPSYNKKVYTGKTKLYENPKECIRDMLLCRDIDVSAWGKIYKRELFSGVTYPEGKLFEDIATTPQLFIKARRIYLNSTPHYNYIFHKKSISHDEFFRNKLDLIDETKNACSKILKRFPELEDECNIRIFHAYMSTIKNYAESRKKEKPTSLIESTAEIYREIKNKKNISSAEYYGYLVLSKNYANFRTICKLRKKVVER